jgi:peptide/nickel transport system substrate-binding protein
LQSLDRNCRPGDAVKRALIALALSALCACAPAGGRQGGTPHVLRYAVGSGDPTTLNIHLNPHANVAYIAQLTAAWFVRYDHAGRLVPELITVIPTQHNGGISADGKTITWHLRRGVRWSDGVPFDARDVVFSVRTIMNPANNEEQGRAGWDLIEHIATPNPYTVVFRLRKPYADFLPVYFGTAGDNPCILPEHLLGRLPTINNAAYNSKPVGIGPFRVVQWRRGDAIELEANPYYFRGRPKLQRIIFKILPSYDTLAAQLQSGEVDVWPLVPPTYVDRIKALPHVAVDVEAGFRTTNIDFALPRPLVADRRVREAVARAIDRSKLIVKALHGYGFRYDGIALPLDPPVPGRVAFAYDPHAAAALLDAAGWRLGADGFRTKSGQRLVLSVPYQTGAPDLDEQVELIRADLHAAGIAIETKKYQPGLLFGLLQEGGIVDSGHYDFTLYPRQLTDIEDAYGLYGCRNIVPNGENATRYCSHAADELFAQLESTYEPVQRRTLFAHLQAQIIRDLPTVILYVAKTCTAWNDAVHGYHPSPLTPFDDMMNVDIQ